MRYLSLFLLAAGLCSLPAHAAKDWKGQPYDTRFNVGVLGGIGVFDGVVGFSLPVTVAYKIVHQGFAPDMNDQVYLEGEAGPLFIAGGTGFQFSGHLRWDFNKDSEWTLFALGGVGGLVKGPATEIFPRFGIGAIWYLWETIALRAEVSHELIAGGLHIAF